MSRGDPREDVSILHKWPKSNMATICNTENKYLNFFGGIYGKFFEIKVKQTLGSYNTNENQHGCQKDGHHFCMD